MTGSAMTSESMPTILQLPRSTSFESMFTTGSTYEQDFAPVVVSDTESDPESAAVLSYAHQEVGLDFSGPDAPSEASCASYHTQDLSIELTELNHGNMMLPEYSPETPEDKFYPEARSTAEENTCDGMRSQKTSDDTEEWDMSMFVDEDSMHD